MSLTYRRLHPDELAELEKEFVRFLAANSITADDWQALKAKEPEKAEALIDTFSDMVFDKVLGDVGLMERRSPQDVRFFHFVEDGIELIGLRVEGNQRLDFTSQDAPEEMMAKLKVSGGKLHLYSARRGYNKSRKLEAFELLEQGCLITKDRSLFEALLAMKAAE